MHSAPSSKLGPNPPICKAPAGSHPCGEEWEEIFCPTFPQAQGIAAPPSLGLPLGQENNARIMGSPERIKEMTRELAAYEQ